jgi:hypothetical protein
MIALSVHAAMAVCLPVDGHADDCSLTPHHVGLTFPVERVPHEWACRLQPIIANYTTANKIGPARIALSETLYLYLLDRPGTAAALMDRLDIGVYKAETRTPGVYWGSDGEGTEGVIQLVYEDRTSRIYYVEGIHHSRLLPNITGKAVVLLRMNPLVESQGAEAMETTLVSYTRVDNRILSGVLTVFRSLVGSTVAHKLTKGIAAVNRLGLEMRHHPARVLFEAADPPPLPAEDVAFLNQVLSSSKSSGMNVNNPTAP